MKLDRIGVEVSPYGSNRVQGNWYHPQDSYGALFSPYGAMGTPNDPISMFLDRFPGIGPYWSLLILVEPY